MIKSTNKTEKPTIKKKDFIDFLASATPEEVNEYIREKGKPRKPVYPMFFFDNEEDDK